MDRYSIAFGIIVVFLLFLLGGWIVFRKRSKKIRQQVEHLERQLQSILTTSTDGIMVLTPDGTIIYMNDVMGNLLDIDPNAPLLFRRDAPRLLLEGKEQDPWEILKTVPDDPQGSMTLFRQTQITTRRGTTITADIYLKNLSTPKDDQPQYLIILRDLREIFREIASGKRDPLTHLPNRKKAYEDFLKICSRHHLNEERFALMIISLDNFLVAQSMLGHDKTDNTILAVTDALKSLAHVHGYETYHLTYTSFMLILPSVTSLEEIHHLATTIQRTLSDLYSEHRSEIYLTASIGIAVYPESGKTTDLFNNVHMALIEAKKLGAGSSFLFRELEKSHHYDEAKLQHDIQFAAERDELIVFYQPIVDAKDHTIVGAEALMRWQHPEHGLIPPLVFIPLMEKTGFIIEAGRFLIREVIRQQATWKRFGFEEIFISFNASIREIDTPDYVEYLSSQLKEHLVDPRLIKVEVTESLAMSNAEKMLETLSRLSSLGVPISLDDFGTGYTSFSYLTRMPATTLKIDKSFIDNILENRKHQQVVRAIIEVGHALGMEVVAEGIESREMAKLLLDYGVDQLQGYYFSKPVPVYELQGSLAKRPQSASNSDDDLLLVTP